MTRIPPVHLPPKVKWVDEGGKYLGGFLGSPQYGQKNWDGVAERVQKRLRRWKRAQPHLSYRGRVLVINNLVASFLWHRVICLQPLEDLLNGVQKQLLDFFWGGLTGYNQPLYAVHWSKMVRVWSILGARSWPFGYALLKKIAIWIAITKPSPGFSHSAASGGLGYGRECFLLMLQCVHTSSLSDFYQSLLNAWQSLSVCRQQDTDVMKMFVQELCSIIFSYPVSPEVRTSANILYQLALQKYDTSDMFQVLGGNLHRK